MASDTDSFREVALTGRPVRYASRAARPNLYLVKLPSQEAKVKEVVKRYEAHLRKEGEELLRDIGEAVRDQKAAERLFRRLLEEAGLPKLAIEVALGGKA